ncbi:MAG: hypothetical protein ACRC5C_12920 [Bacilli bacterium]
MNKKALKVVAGFVAFGLIVALLYFTNRYVGNPVSKMIATNAAEKYIAQKYAPQNLVIDETNFSVEMNNYHVQVKSNVSIDTHFDLYVSAWGEIEFDEYPDNVGGKFTTYVRIQDAASKDLEPKIKKGVPLDYEWLMVSAGKDSFIPENFELDMPYRADDLPFPIEIAVSVYEPNASWSKVAEILQALDAFATEQKLNVSAYTVLLRESKDEKHKFDEQLGITGFPRERLVEKNLAMALKRYAEEQNKEMTQ